MPSGLHTYKPILKLMAIASFVTTAKPTYSTIILLRMSIYTGQMASVDYSPPFSFKV